MIHLWLALFVIGGVFPNVSVKAETALDPITPRLSTADAGRGEKLFLQCKACHVAEEGASVTVGPNLWGIVNRPVGSQPGFEYTESLREIGGSWDFERLSQYLFDPKAMAPETRMIFDGVKSARDRADLIAFLRTLDKEPATIPEDAASRPGPEYGGLPPGEGREGSISPAALVMPLNNSPTATCPGPSGKSC